MEQGRQRNCLTIHHLHDCSASLGFGEIAASYVERPHLRMVENIVASRARKHRRFLLALAYNWATFMLALSAKVLAIIRTCSQS